MPIYNVLLGKKPSSPDGIYIAKPSIDIFTAENTDLNLSSMRKAMQVLASGSVILPEDATQVIVTLPIDYGYAPFTLLNGPVASDAPSQRYFYKYTSNTEFQITLAGTYANDHPAQLVTYTLFPFPFPLPT